MTGVACLGRSLSCARAQRYSDLTNPIALSHSLAHIAGTQRIIALTHFLITLASLPLPLPLSLPRPLACLTTLSSPLPQEQGLPVPVPPPPHQERLCPPLFHVIATPPLPYLPSLYPHLPSSYHPPSSLVSPFPSVSLGLPLPGFLLTLTLARSPSRIASPLVLTMRGFLFLFLAPSLPHSAPPSLQAFIRVHACAAAQTH